MYTVRVETSFNAMHRVRLSDGSTEPLHGHDWKVHAHFARERLDEIEMVVDFLEVHRALDGVVQELHHTDLGNHPVLSKYNPTAETIARFIFDQLDQSGLSTLIRVDVTEAPGCVASYTRPGETHTE